jgi:hypothetical protein
MRNDVHIPPLSEEERKHGSKVGHDGEPANQPHSTKPAPQPHPREALRGNREPIDTDLTTWDFNTAYLVAAIAGVFGVAALVLFWMLFS